jgi:hypothetical protein
VARDVDDVPALGLVEDFAEAVAGHPVPQHAHVGRPAVGGDPLDEPDQRLPFAAEVERLAA